MFFFQWLYFSYDIDGPIGIRANTGFQEGGVKITPKTLVQINGNMRRRIWSMLIKIKVSELHPYKWKFRNQEYGVFSRNQRFRIWSMLMKIKDSELHPDQWKFRNMVYLVEIKDIESDPDQRKSGGGIWSRKIEIREL